MNPPSPRTQRLLACLEQFHGEEDGAIGREDWAGLAEIFDREFAVVSQLARAGESADAATVDRVRTLQARFQSLEATLGRHHASLREEHDGIRRATRTRRAIKRTYGRDQLPA